MLHLLPDYISNLLQIILTFLFLLISYHKPLYNYMSTMKKFIPTLSDTAKQGSLLSIRLRHPG